MPFWNFAGVIVLFPLAGFIANGLLGPRLPRRVSGIIGCGAVGLSFALALAILAEMVSSTDRTHTITFFTWISAGSFSVNAAYQVDQLSILMTLIITGVGFLIHVYSVGYMAGDPAFPRFFAYLNLFIFMMLNLVLADNFLLMFLGWEGVGLCSYLLIGFWYDRKFDTGGYAPGTAFTADAAKKAFIVNRIGDFGFLIAMLMMFTMFGSLTFGDVFARAAAIGSRGEEAYFWVTLLLFLGAAGKSAQIPLYVWLPDAMAGPTPVSALIHAATMVTAGVYMVARCSVLYALAPVTMDIVAAIGLATALLAASIGLVQNDIKKILAYSTVSQLGYMFLALGVGSFSAGVFHLMTHAFFKALLFLGAGAIIHAMQDEQDIQNYGGLRAAMPVTYKTFLVAALAIAGIPPLSGFFSKDEILFSAFSNGSPLLWLLAWITAGLTAFYMFRLVFLTFHGTPRWGGKHPHEVPPAMAVPLIILAVLSALGGLAGIPESLGPNAISEWLEPVFARARPLLEASHNAEGEFLLMALSVAIAIAGILFARYVYIASPELPQKISAGARGIYALLRNKCFVDEAYDAAIVSPSVKLSEKLLWKGFDAGLVDGAVNGAAWLAGRTSAWMRRIQGGVVQGYALAFVLGIIVILGVLLAR